ncbi:hypothetical protein [Streptomyces zingiberis]|uniref:Roadblock/LC7 domain-containing protein n=1 Tax=Streptomyces zingiberis TaxID=2053010 RepID=A0ABX1BVN8_9ACTN|nr:hypothetical protein [Streptomyces zingiberis]NJQ00590.1 hypothetical protein [Streptomyces zingiberis]
MPGIDACLADAMALPGARGAAVIEWTSGLTLGTVGEPPNGDYEVTAAELAELARLAAEHTAFGSAEPGRADGVPAEGPPGGTSGGPPGGGFPGAPPGAPPGGSVAYGSGGPGGPVPVEDLLLTTRTGYHLLRFVEDTLDGAVVVYLWLDRENGNLALARLRLRDLVAGLALI